MNIIRTIDELSSEWLSDVLKTPVSSFNATRIGTGQVSACYRVELQYTEPDPQHPATVVLKIAASDPTSRHAGQSLGIYEKETRFYQDIAPLLGGPLAKCYHAEFEDDFFSLVISDAAPAIVGDDIEGATIAQARLAMSELGRLHGPPLRKSLLTTAGWLAKPSRINQAVIQQLFMGYIGRYKDKLSEENLGVMHRLVACFDAYLEKQRNQPIHGLVHGDFRLDNMLFGEPGADKPLTVVDWQTVTYGPPLSDTAYFLGCSLPIETRRAHFDELASLYHAGLGPEPPLTLEQCRQGIREQSFFGVVMGIVSPMLVERTERGDEMFMAMMERHCAQVLDLGALETLPAAVALKPLEPEDKDEHPHSKTDEPLWNESWYFDAVDQKQKVGAYVRLGLTPNQTGSWYSAVVTLPDGSCVSVTDFKAPHPGNDLTVKTNSIHATQSVVDPLKAYRVTLKGQGELYPNPAAILNSEKGSDVDVELDLTWHTEGTPYMWRLTPRYEIPCAISGSFTVGGKTTQLSRAPGQRDHSWGARDWWGADWMWCAFHFDDGTRIHGADLRIPGRPRMSVGYIQGPRQEVTELLTCSSDEEMGNDGLPVRAAVTIKSSAGEEFVVEVSPHGQGPLLLVADDGRVANFTRAWVKVQASDGRSGVGWIEWNHQKKT